MLSNRLRKVLLEIISPLQVGYVPDRHIENNIFLVHEMAFDINKKVKEPNMLLKLDMKKAYDRLDWSFILAMFKAFGFGTWLIDLVYCTLSNNWFSIMIDGQPAGFFKSFKGLRKRDLLSLALFIIATEYLVKGITTVLDRGRRLFFYSIGGQFPCLSFVDNMMIFTEISKDGLLSIKNFLQHYQKISA